MVRKVGVYIHLAVVCFLWAEVLLLNLAFEQWPGLPPIEAYIIALALTGLLANFALTALLPPQSAIAANGAGPRAGPVRCAAPLGSAAALPGGRAAGGQPIAASILVGGMSRRWR